MKKPSYYNMHKSCGIGLCKSADNSSRKEMNIMQKRTLKYALLGLLCHDNLSGYDLYLEFDKALSEFWSAKHSQIYPELKKLTEEGKVSYDIEISGTALEKKVYSITEAGRKDFLNWLNTFEPMQPTAKDVFRLRLFFGAELEQEARLKMLRQQLGEHEARLAHLRNSTSKFDNVTDRESPAYFDSLILLGAIMREENYCKWLETCIERLSD